MVVSFSVFEMFSLGYQVGSVKVQKVIVVSKKVFFHAKPSASLNTVHVRGLYATDLLRRVKLYQHV